VEQQSTPEAQATLFATVLAIIVGACVYAFVDAGMVSIWLFVPGLVILWFVSRGAAYQWYRTER
jgi:hypothetical protein